MAVCCYISECAPVLRERQVHLMTQMDYVRHVAVLIYFPRTCWSNTIAVPVKSAYVGWPIRIRRISTESYINGSIGKTSFFYYALSNGVKYPSYTAYYGMEDRETFRNMPVMVVKHVTGHSRDIIDCELEPSEERRVLAYLMRLPIS